MKVLAKTLLKQAVVSRGYCSHVNATIAVYIAGSRRGVTLVFQRDLRRCGAIESIIGQISADGRLALCALRGALGDVLHALLFAYEHHIRINLTHLRAVRTQIPALLFSAFETKAIDERSDCGLTARATSWSETTNYRARDVVSVVVIDQRRPEKMK